MGAEVLKEKRTVSDLIFRSTKIENMCSDYENLIMKPNLSSGRGWSPGCRSLSFITFDLLQSRQEAHTWYILLSISKTLLPELSIHQMDALPHKRDRWWATPSCKQWQVLWAWDIRSRSLIHAHFCQQVRSPYHEIEMRQRGECGCWEGAPLKPKQTGLRKSEVVLLGRRCILMIVVLHRGCPRCCYYKHFGGE